jgi:hypothetical protein
MAIGRISGPLLKENLLRDGVNLRFESNLIYLDVNTHADDVSTNPADPSLWTGRVGIRNSNPAYPLDVTGTARATTILGGELDIDEIYINDNSVSSQLGDLVLSAATSLDKVTINSNVLVNGNLHATGSITADGSLQLGNDDTDNVVFAADINSDFIPNITDTFKLGTPSKRWDQVNVHNANIGDIQINDNVIEPINTNSDLVIRANGSGTIILDTTSFQLENIRIVGNVIETTDTNSDLDLRASGSGTVLANGRDLLNFDVTTWFVSEDSGSDGNDGRHTYSAFASLKYALTQVSSGDTVLLAPGTYTEQFPITVPQGVTVKGAGLRATKIVPTLATQDNDCFLLNGETTIEDLTVADMFYNSGANTGYAFRFAPNTTVTLRSPYVQRVTVLNKGSGAGPGDPYGFVSADAGRGAYLDGSQVTRNSIEAAILFNEATFIVPNSRALIMTNGARTEWLTCFTYFADLAIEGVVGATGRGGDGKTYVTFGGVSGSGFQVGETVRLTSTDASTVIDLIVDSVDGGKITVDGSVGTLEGEDFSPASIVGLVSGTTATSVTRYDRSEFAAELRAIAGANIYGNQGVKADGDDVVIQLMAHNFAYIGTGADLTNDKSAVVQANEVIEVNGGRVYYNSVDQVGNFRVGDLFTVNFETGAVSFAAPSFDVSSLTGITFTDGSNVTIVNPTTVQTGNLVLAGNTLSSLTGPINIDPSGSEQLNLNADTVIAGNLNVGGNVTIGGAITIGDADTDSITIVADFTSNLLPNESNTYDLGSATKEWRTIYAGQFTNGNIVIDDNYVRTTESNSNLELQANGTGDIELQSDTNVTGNITVSNNATVQGDLTVQGNTVVVGSSTQQGNFNVTGTLTVTGDIVGGPLRTDDIQIVGNKVETTQSNSDLELDAAGTGTIELLTDTNITGTVDVSGQATLASANIEDLTAGRVVLAGVNGELEDSANLTFDGTLLTVTGNQQITGNLTVDGNITLGGNIRIGDQDVDTITVAADFTSDLIPDVSNTYDLGSSLKQWRVVNAAEFDNGVINVNDNVITTTVSNADLELRASGTGEILIPNNNVTISNSLDVDGNTTLDNTTIDGTFIVNGNSTLNGDLTVTGATTYNGSITITDNVTVSGVVTVGALQTDDIFIDGNVITTTQSNSNLELRANGTGTIELQENTNVTGTFDVSGQSTLASVNVGDLTSGRVVLAGTSGELEDSANLTFNGSELTVTGDQTVTGTVDVNTEINTPVGNITTVNTGLINVDSITINDNTIRTTVSNADLELTPSGTGIVYISGTGAVRIPAGNTAERPPTGESGFIRYNSQTNNIEAWNGVVFAGISGGGSSSDANGDTRLTFETSGNNEDTIRFFAGVAGLTPGSTIGSNEIMTVSNEGVVISGTIRIQNNVIENINSNEDLIIRASGAGRVILDGSGEPGATGNVFATDPLLSLNTSQTGSNSYDSGLIIERGTEINTGFIWDESADEFAAISTIEQGTVRGNVAITGYQNVSVASVKLNSETVNKVTFTDANKVVRSLDTGRSADVGGLMKFTAGSELAIPAGTTAQRPASPQTASVRYNSDLDYFEGYAGSSWQGLGIGFGTAPSYQGIVANGTDFEFTLDLAPLSAAGIIVTINGVVQEPEYAYEVEDNVLRFIDESSTVITPDLGDRIDVRFLSKPAISSVRERSFLGDGSTRTFGMSLPIASKAEVLVFVNNIYQDVEVYSVSGKNVIFVQAPQSDDRINIVHIAGIVAPNVATIQEADDSAIAFAIALG